MNEALRLCVGRLARRDFDLAFELLGCGRDAFQDPEIIEMSVDTALFARGFGAADRRPRRRAIDRVTAKRFKDADPLVAALISSLPTAIFSLFEVESVSADGLVSAKDLLDDGRRLTIMDLSLAKSADVGALFCGRFVDLGRWRIGFGIVIPLRKSEAVAVTIGLSPIDELSAKREALHPLVYLSRIHDRDLVLDAVAPLIDLLATAIDEGEIDIAEAAGRLMKEARTPTLF